MSLGLLIIHLSISGCFSLKEKRSRLKPLLARLHREFNISVAELDNLDNWQESTIGVALVSNDRKHIQRSLQTVKTWIEEYWPDVEVINYKVELI